MGHNSSRPMASGPSTSTTKLSELKDGDRPHVNLTEAEWKEKLTPAEYAVLREKDTEARWKGYTNNKDEGRLMNMISSMV